MSRSLIVQALVKEIKKINGAPAWKSNLYENVLGRLKFWDEVNDFPFVCVVAGSEKREYLPGALKWAYLSISIKVYVQDEDAVDKLDSVLFDIERIIDKVPRLEYSPGKWVEDIQIESIMTDEGVLNPMGVGDMTLTVRYNVY